LVLLFGFGSLGHDSRSPSRSPDPPHHDNHSAAVLIVVGEEGSAVEKYCNGTLIDYHSKVYVWTIAHDLVDTTQEEMPLLPHIRLLLPGDYKNPSAGKLESLIWVRARHSYHRFPWKEEQEEGKRSTPLLEEHRRFDVLLFELHPKHLQLAKRARQAYEPHRHHRHGRFVGRVLMPGTLVSGSHVAAPAAAAAASASCGSSNKVQRSDSASDPELEGSKIAWTNIRGYLALTLPNRPHITGLNSLITIDGSGHDAVGCGLLDQENHLQGVIASVWASEGFRKGLPMVRRSFAVRASAFFALMQEEEKDASRVKVCVNPLAELGDHSEGGGKKA
jgi:hypothetical protein